METHRRLREVRKCRSCGRPIPEFRGQFTAYCSRSCLYRSEGEPQRKEAVTIPKDDSKDWSRIHELLSEVRSERIRPARSYPNVQWLHHRKQQDQKEQAWEDEMREAFKKERRKIAKGHESRKLTKWGKPRKAADTSKTLKRKQQIARAFRRLYVKRLFKEGKISRPHIPDHETKRCEICGKHLPSHDFRICSKSPDGLQPYCLVCTEKGRKKKARNYHRAWMAKRQAVRSHPIG
jgi:hypothetical protein